VEETQEVRLNVYAIGGDGCSKDLESNTHSVRRSAYNPLKQGNKESRKSCIDASELRKQRAGRPQGTATEGNEDEVDNGLYGRANANSIHSAECDALNEEGDDFVSADEEELNDGVNDLSNLKMEIKEETHHKKNNIKTKEVCNDMILD